MKLKPYLKNLIYLALILNLTISAGCSQRPPSILEKTSVENKLLDSFNKSFKLKYPLYTSTNIAGKTFWIYIATEKDILTLSPASIMGGVTPEKIIKFLEIKCNHQNSVFNLDYIFIKYNDREKQQEKDIFKKTAVGGTLLYQDFTDTAIEVLGKTYQAIGDIISEVKDMNFFVICLANIKKGTKIIFVTHRLDIEQYLLRMLPQDEFYKRMIIKIEGSKDILNDKYGLHIEYNDVSLIDFLREQIVNNSRSKIGELEKYEPEKLKSLDKIDDILLENVYKVTTKYEFDDFLFVEIKNILTKEKLSISKSKLTNRFNDAPPILPSEEYNF